MKRTSLALAAILVAAAGCEAAKAPPATGARAVPEAEAAPGTPAYQPPAPGTIVVVRHGDGALQTSRVLGSEGYALAMLREGERITRVPFCFRCESPPDGETGVGQYRALWPLEVGKSATFQRRGADGAVRVHDVAVTGTETVATDFGPVETLVIEETVTDPAPGGWRARRKQWFSPRLGWAVRSEWEAPGDSGGWELAAIALPQ